MGSTDSEILEPIEEKKLLNSLAINKGSVQGVLLISSLVIGMFVLPNVTLRRSQVFVDIFHKI